MQLVGCVYNRNMSDPDELPDDDEMTPAPCPACGGPCEVLAADLWQCETCGAVVSAAQIMDGPHNFEPLA